LSGCKVGFAMDPGVRLPIVMPRERRGEEEIKRCENYKI